MTKDALGSLPPAIMCPPSAAVLWGCPGAGADASAPSSVVDGTVPSPGEPPALPPPPPAEVDPRSTTRRRRSHAPRAATPEPRAGDRCPRAAQATSRLERRTLRDLRPAPPPTSVQPSNTSRSERGLGGPS